MTVRKSKLSHLSEQERLEHRRHIAREKAKRYAKRHPEQRRSLRRKAYARNGDTERARARQQVREWTPERSEKQNARRAKNSEKTRGYNRNYKRERRSVDTQFRVAECLRSRLTKLVRTKRGSAVHDLGCTLVELVIFLEEQFEPGMSWDNYGSWHIDHIIPLGFFDLTDHQQFLSAAHWTNLQPRWSLDNLRKGGRIERPTLW